MLCTNKTMSGNASFVQMEVTELKIDITMRSGLLKWRKVMETNHVKIMCVGVNQPLCVVSKFFPMGKMERGGAAQGGFVLLFLFIILISLYLCKLHKLFEVTKFIFYVHIYHWLIDNKLFLEKQSQATNLGNRTEFYANCTLGWINFSRKSYALSGLFALSGFALSVALVYAFFIWPVWSGFTLNLNKKVCSKPST